MNDTERYYPTASLTITIPRLTGGLLTPTDEQIVVEDTIDVTISGAHDPRHLINAVAIAADNAVRAVTPDAPAEQTPEVEALAADPWTSPRQCGRTYSHDAHSTDEGWCPGLSGGGGGSVAGASAGGNGGGTPGRRARR